MYIKELVNYITHSNFASELTIQNDLEIIKYFETLSKLLEGQSEKSSEIWDMMPIVSTECIDNLSRFLTISKHDYFTELKIMCQNNNDYEALQLKVQELLSKINYTTYTEYDRNIKFNFYDSIKIPIFVDGIEYVQIETANELRKAKEIFAYIPQLERVGKSTMEIATRFGSLTPLEDFKKSADGRTRQDILSLSIFKKLKQ